MEIVEVQSILDENGKDVCQNGGTPMEVSIAQIITLALLSFALGMQVAMLINMLVQREDTGTRVTDFSDKTEKM